MLKDLGKIQDKGNSSRGSRQDTGKRVQAVVLEDLGKIQETGYRQ